MKLFTFKGTLILDDTADGAWHQASALAGSIVKRKSVVKMENVKDAYWTSVKDDGDKIDAFTVIMK